MERIIWAVLMIVAVVLAARLISRSAPHGKRRKRR
jgi:hypothetical protein